MKKTIILILLISIVIIVGVVILISNRSVENSTPTGKVIHTQNEPLKMAFPYWLGDLPFFVAKEKNLFNNVNVEFETMDVGALKTAFKKGDIDVLSATPELVPILYDAGIDFKVILTTDYSYGADGIVATSDITSLKSLKGKKIAYEVGSPSHWYLLYKLDQVGLTQDDIITIDMAVPDAGAAFAAGRVDVAVTWEPWLSKAKERDGGHILASTADDHDRIVPAIVVVKDSTLKQRKQEIKELMKGWFRGLEYTKNNKQEACSVAMDVYGLSSQEVEEWLLGLKWLDYEDNLQYWGINEESGEFKKIIKKAGELWFNAGLSKKQPSLKEVVDSTLLETLY